MVPSLKSMLLGVAGLWSQLQGVQAQSSLGTTDQSTFPYFLSNGAALRTGTPWGTDTVNNTNPYTQQPAGSIRTYDFTITRGTIAPDGVSRSVLLVNGQFPGPTIEANWGDTIQVTVHNKIIGPEEGTALHWHGIPQSASPWEDGTPGVAQCPIAPGESYTYSFQASLYGSSFYHSHYSAQYTGGLFGALLIYGPWSQSYNQDKGPVLLSDWGHETYEQQVVEAVGPGNGLVFTDSSLINGKVNANFTFTSGQSYRLRIVNAAAEAPYTFSIDEHSFNVIAHDFVPVIPYTTTSISLGAGQRADIIVNATGDPSKSYWMRSAPNDCSLLKTKTPAKAAIFYQNASQKVRPSSKAQSYSTGCTFTEIPNFGQPAYSMNPPTTPATSQTLNVTTWVNATGNPVWTFNKVVYHANYDEPPLLLSNAKKLSFPYAPSWNIYNFGSNTSVRLVVYNYNVQSSHPMHMHGHNFWVMAEGYGIWNGQVATKSNPPRRDTVMLNAGQSASSPAYVVLEYNQDNPGVWPFHCHIAWHVSAGLSINLVERPSDIANLKIPSKLNDGCTAFKNWQKTHVVNEIDSGLSYTAMADH